MRRVHPVQGHKSVLAFGLVGEGDESVPVVAMLGRVRSSMANDGACVRANSTPTQLVPPLRRPRDLDRRISNTRDEEIRR